MLKVGDYAIARSLIGFDSDPVDLRVRVTHAPEHGQIVTVVTADLLDAGTLLVLDPSRVDAEAADEAVRHSSGLVFF